MKLFLKSVICIVLCLSMMAVTFVPIFAADRNTYISDIKICYAEDLDSAKEAFGEGYTVIEQNLTEGTYDNFPNGQKNVYIGYKTTRDVSEAITDISAMNMYGKFDTTSFDTVLANFYEAVEEEVDALSTMAEEYRENYFAEQTAGTSGKAHVAYELLTYYLDDYISDEEGNPQTLAEVFLNKSGECTDEHLADILVKGNSALIVNVQNILMSAQSTDSQTWIQRLSQTSYNKLKENIKKISAQYESDAAVEKYMKEQYGAGVELLMEHWEGLYLGMKTYVESGITKDVTEEELDEATDSGVCKNEALIYGTIYEMLGTIPYDGKTLRDLFYVTPEEMSEHYEQYYPIISVLSRGELASLRNIDISELIMSGLSYNVDYDKSLKAVQDLKDDNIQVAIVDVELKNDTESLYQMTDYQIVENEDGAFGFQSDIENTQVTYELVDTVEADVISIFAGVDQGFFEKGVAMTGDAIKYMASSGVTPSSDEDEENDEKHINAKVIALSVGAGVALATSVVSLVYSSHILSYAQGLKERAEILFSYKVPVENGGQLFDFAEFIEKTDKTLEQYYNVAKKANGTVRNYFTSSNNRRLIDLPQAAVEKYNIKPKKTTAMDAEGHRYERLEYSDGYSQMLKDTADANRAEREMALRELSKSDSINYRKALSKWLGIGFLTVFAVLMVFDIISIVNSMDDLDEQQQELKKKPFEYDIDIPARMVSERTTIEEDDEGNEKEVKDYFFYTAVTTPDGKPADIYGFTQKEWVALYTTKEDAAGDPILANNFIIQVGSSNTPNGCNGGVSIFGATDAKVQNLHDASVLKLVEKDELGGLYIFYESHEYVPGGLRASVFTNLPVMISIIAVAVLAAGFATFAIIRKKKSPKAVN